MSAYGQVVPPATLKAMVSHLDQKKAFDAQNPSPEKRKFVALMLLWGSLADLMKNRYYDICVAMHEAIREAEECEATGNEIQVIRCLIALHRSAALLHESLTILDRAKIAESKAVIKFVTGASL